MSLSNKASMRSIQIYSSYYSPRYGSSALAAKKVPPAAAFRSLAFSRTRSRMARPPSARAFSRCARTTLPGPGAHDHSAARAAPRAQASSSCSSPQRTCQTPQPLRVPRAGFATPALIGTGKPRAEPRHELHHTLPGARIALHLAAPSHALAHETHLLSCGRRWSTRPHTPHREALPAHPLPVAPAAEAKHGQHANAGPCGRRLVSKYLLLPWKVQRPVECHGE